MLTDMHARYVKISQSHYHEGWKLFSLTNTNELYYVLCLIVWVCNLYNTGCLRSTNVCQMTSGQELPATILEGEDNLVNKNESKMQENGRMTVSSILPIVKEPS